MKFFAEPTVRLFLRALLVAAVAFSSKFFLVDQTGQHITYQTAALAGAATAAVLAFAEVFTPLNALVGHGKTGTLGVQLESELLHTVALQAPPTLPDPSHTSPTKPKRTRA